MNVHFGQPLKYQPQDIGRADYSENGIFYVNKKWDKVKEQYRFPFELYDYQRATVDALAGAKASGLWFEVGTGKTPTSVAMALYQMMEHKGQTIVLMPPIILSQWKRFIDSVGGINGSTIYAGTVKQRAEISLEADFILMSMEIFKNDFEYLCKYFQDKNVTMIVDEAVSIKNPSTLNHIAVAAFCDNDPARLLAIKAKRSRKSKAKKPENLKNKPQNFKPETLDKLNQLRNEIRGRMASWGNQ